VEERRLSKYKALSSIPVHRKEKKTVTNMAAINQIISAIPFNVSGINIPIETEVVRVDKTNKSKTQSYIVFKKSTLKTH
jgi:hypothetical protein